MVDRPVYVCRFADKEPPLEGELCGTVWDRAEVIESAFHLVGTVSDRSRSYLSARALWDDDALHVAFESDPSSVPVTKRRRDEDLFNECAVEVFLMAGGGYYEIEVSPLGTVLDLYFPDVAEQNWRAMAEYDVPGLRWTVGETDEVGRWTARLAIPWTGVPEVSRGKRDGQPCVFGNFARSQMLPDGDHDLTSWTSTSVAFCELEAMGTLVLAL